MISEGVGVGVRVDQITLLTLKLQNNEICFA